MSERTVRLFQTAAHTCGYFADRQAQDILIDPHDPATPWVYAQALSAGFRRSGAHIYRPRCPQCQACQPLRLPLLQFRPSRAQQRCRRRNADLSLRTDVRIPSDEHFALYQKYLRQRHPQGGMDQGTRWDFESFARAEWSPTHFFELRLREQLVAVAVTDVFPEALSAVYTFFDPDLPERSLGTAAILRQIDWGLSRHMRHLYLGFFIEGHPKMHYKSRFGPAEVLRQGEWRPLQPGPAPAGSADHGDGISQASSAAAPG